MDGWVGSRIVDQIAAAGESVLGSLLYGGNKRVDGVMGLTGDSRPLLRGCKGVVEFCEF